MKINWFQVTLIVIILVVVLFFISIFTTSNLRQVGELSPTNPEFQEETGEAHEEAMTEEADTVEDEQVSPTTETESKSPVEVNPKKQNNPPIPEPVMMAPEPDIEPEQPLKDFEEDIAEEFPGERITTRSPLLRNQVEETGYGLYSYLLFSHPPENDFEKEKYHTLLTLFFRRFQPTEEIEQFVSREKINITYIPIHVENLPDLRSKPKAEQAEWYLKHYDYARAKAWLSLIPNLQENGPYIFSILEPLKQGLKSGQPYMLQDMSHVNAELCGLWLQRFETQAAQQEFWKENIMSSFVVNLRNAIAVMATGVETVGHSMSWWKEHLDSWIFWKKK